MIEETHYQDLKAVADCHRKVFPESLSTAMGRKYVIKMLEWYISNDHAFLYHIEKGEKVVGYYGAIVADGSLGTGSASGMLQHSFNRAVLAFLINPLLLFRPELKQKYRFIIKNFGRKMAKLLGIEVKSDTATSKENSVNPHIGLVVIGVSPEYRGKGYGSLILQHFNTKGKDYDISQLRLSVSSQNIGAITAYKKNGYVVKSETALTTQMTKSVN